MFILFFFYSLQCLLALPLVLYAFSPSVRPEPPTVLKVAALAFAVRFLPAIFGMTTAKRWLLFQWTRLRGQQLFARAPKCNYIHDHLWLRGTCGTCGMWCGM